MFDCSMICVIKASEVSKATFNWGTSGKAKMLNRSKINTVGLCFFLASIIVKRERERGGGNKEEAKLLA